MPNGQPADRRSLTVRKVGAELNRAIEIRRALAEHADDPALGTVGHHAHHVAAFDRVFREQEARQPGRLVIELGIGQRCVGGHHGDAVGCGRDRM